MRFKVIYALITVMLLMQTAQAGCVGDLKVVDIPTLEAGDSISIVTYTSISPSLGTRNLDLMISDPHDDVIYTKKLQLSDDTTTVEAKLDIDDNFINGEYTFFAVMVVTGDENITEEICSESASEMFIIKSDRTRYEDIAINISIDWEFEAKKFNLEKDVKTGDNLIRYKISGIAPTGWNISISPESNSTPSGGEITIDGTQYLILSRYNQLVDKLAELEWYYGTQSDVLNSTYAKLTKWEDLYLQEKTLKGAEENKSESYLRKLNTCQNDLVEMDQEKGKLHGWNTTIIYMAVSAIVTVILVIVALNYIGGRKPIE